MRYSGIHISISRFHCIISLRIAPLCAFFSRFFLALVWRLWDRKHRATPALFAITRDVIDEIMQLNFQINISLLDLFGFGFAFEFEFGETAIAASSRMGPKLILET